MRNQIKLFLSSCIAVSPLVARASQDAWPLYEKAAATIREGDKQNIMAPAASNNSYPGCPPYPEGWQRQEKAAYEHNAEALEAVHKAASMNEISWPVRHKGKDVDLWYLSEMRNVANEVADAAIYDQIRGDDRTALQRINDLLHAADLLDRPEDELVVQGLVAVGIRAIAMSRLNVIATELHIVPKQAEGTRSVSVDEIKQLIARLFSTQTDPTQKLDALHANENALGLGPPAPPESVERVKKTYRRIQMEQNLVAMVLACDLYRFEHSQWPASVDDLKGYLPAAPVDAWGPMGYVLIRGGTPDGKDRPLVYSRCEANGRKLAYPVREPFYNYYNGGSLGTPTDAFPPGQFRDVTLWVPGKVQSKDVLRELQ